MLHNPQMGPIGRVTRLVVGAGLLYLAQFAGTSWSLRWYDAVLGLVVLPGAMLIVGLVARRRSEKPLRFTGTSGTTANCALIIALISNSYTRPGAELFYGATLLVAAWRGQLGCEATAISNWLLNRDDQVGCPIFTSIDRVEARRSAAKGGGRTASGSSRSAGSLTPER